LETPTTATVSGSKKPRIRSAPEVVLPTP